MKHSALIAAAAIFIMAAGHAHAQSRGVTPLSPNASTLSGVHAQPATPLPKLAIPPGGGFPQGHPTDIKACKKVEPGMPMMDDPLDLHASGQTGSEGPLCR